MQCIVDKLQTISGLAVCLAGLVYHGAVFAKAAQRGDVTTLHRARCIVYLVTSTPAVALLVLIIIDDTELSTYIVLNILRIGNALCTSAASAEVCWKLSRNITPFQRIANDLIGLAAFAQMVILGFGFWQYATKGSQWLWIAVAPQTMVLLFVTLHLSHYSAGEHENSGNATENDDVRRSTAIQITSRRRARRQYFCNGA
ncbi:hypothetical protein LEL_10948 [Akanthomyces lecanii RCEF 1005]|uniref:Uncharacterized protein n=1 Tax=Akanthomyces lecanii RCEF 1005 TaxID=1081108 RepID=A0A167PQP9_CORDF|nr:hypothetical protein LEL_10948 [Akanthomyces lecanii RCEF 1005]